MRPKFVLWLAVAVIWSAWYNVDPQAQAEGADIRAVGQQDDSAILSIVARDGYVHRLALDGAR